MVDTLLHSHLHIQGYLWLRREGEKIKIRLMNGFFTEDFYSKLTPVGTVELKARMKDINLISNRHAQSIKQCLLRHYTEPWHAAIKTDLKRSN